MAGIFCIFALRKAKHMASPILDLSKPVTRSMGVISYTKDGKNNDFYVYKSFWSCGYSPAEWLLKDFLMQMILQKFLIQ